MAIPALIAAAARILGPALSEMGGAAGSKMTKLEELLSKVPSATKDAGKTSGGPWGDGGGGRNLGDKALDVAEMVHPAVMAVVEVGKVLMGGMTKMLRQGTQLVNNDFGGFVQSLDIIPAPVKRFVAAIEDAARAITRRTDELKGLNASLAQASASREVKLLQADIREANRLGPSYKRVTDESTELEIKLRQLSNPFKESLANIETTLLKIFNAAAKIPALQTVAEAGAGFLEGMAVGTKNMGVTLGLIYGLQADEADRKKIEGAPPDQEMMNELFKGLGQQVGAARNGPPPMPNAKDAPLGIRLIP